MITEPEVMAALNFIKENAADYGKVKAERRYLESFTKTLRARLFQDAPAGTVADRDAFADGHSDMDEHLIGLKVAVEMENKLYWQITAAQIQIEIWRTQEASNRRMDRAAQ